MVDLVWEDSLKRYISEPKCHASMLQIRELALKKPSIKECLLDVVSPMKVTG